MKLLAHIGRIIGLALLGPVRRVPDGEVAVIDPWIDDNQWLAGLPHECREPVGWRWWRSQ
jgi:hypothetical protein